MQYVHLIKARPIYKRQTHLLVTNKRQYKPETVRYLSLHRIPRTERNNAKVQHKNGSKTSHSGQNCIQVYFYSR
jgi:hypothetical protein